MAKCIGCGKFKLFGSFPGGYCPECTEEKRLEQQKREEEAAARRAAEEEAARKAEAEAAARRAAEEEAARKAEAEAAARRAAEEAAARKAEAEVAALKAAQEEAARISAGKRLAYTYPDVDMFMPHPEVRSLPGFQRGAVLSVAQDKENAHDPHAVRLSLGGQAVGYLYRNRLQDMANDFLSKGDPVLAVLLDPGTGKQAKLRLEFYDNLGALGHCLARHPDAKAWRLTGNGGEEMQDNILCCNRGDECTLDFDPEKEKYLVISGFEIGYLPAGAAKLVDSLGEFRCAVYVADTDTTDSGKESISVYIFPADA